MSRVRRPVRKRKATKHGRGLKPMGDASALKAKAPKKGKKIGGQRIGPPKPRLKSLSDHKLKKAKDKRARRRMKGQEHWRGGFSGPGLALLEDTEPDDYSNPFLDMRGIESDLAQDTISGDDSRGSS